MRDYAEHSRRRFINQQRLITIKTCLWFFSILVFYVALIGVALIFAGCSTFNDTHEVLLKNDFDALARFDVKKFGIDQELCRQQSDVRTIGPWLGIAGFASFPIGAVLALAGATHAHIASNKTEVDYKQCMRDRGYDVRVRVV